MAHVCPTCGFAPPKKYKYSMDDLNVSVLLKMWNYVIRHGTNQVNMNDIDLTRAEHCRVTQLRFHALIAKLKRNGRHVPAHWLITKRGSDFLHGRIVIPRYVFTQANKVIGRSEDEHVSRQDYKVLKSFEPTYEIIDNQLKHITSEQLNLFLNSTGGGIQSTGTSRSNAATNLSKPIV